MSLKAKSELYAMSVAKDSHEWWEAFVTKHSALISHIGAGDRHTV